MTATNAFVLPRMIGGATSTIFLTPKGDVADEAAKRAESFAISKSTIIELIEMDEPSMMNVRSIVMPRVETLMNCNVVEAATELEKELEVSQGLGPDERQSITEATSLLVEFLEEFVEQMTAATGLQQSH